jgi:hypothetical protein
MGLLAHAPTCHTRRVPRAWRRVLPTALVAAAILAMRFAAPFLAPQPGREADVATDRPPTRASASRAAPAPTTARTTLGVPPAPCPGPKPAAPFGTTLRLHTGLHAPRFEPRCLVAPAHRSLSLRLTNDLAGLRTRLGIYDVGSGWPSRGGSDQAEDSPTAVFVGRSVSASSSVHYRLPALRRGVYLLQGDTFPSLMRAFLIVAGTTSPPPVMAGGEALAGRASPPGSAPPARRPTFGAVGMVRRSER